MVAVDPYFLFTLPVSFFAGLTQGLTGFGSALVAMPFFIKILPARIAVTLSILNGLSITSILTVRHLSSIRPKRVLPLMVGSIPGMALGIIFLKGADESLIRRLLGLILIGYSLYSLMERPHGKRQISPVWGLAAGFFTGVIGAAFSAGGPPAIIYVTLTGWEKDEIKGTLSAFFLFSCILISIGHLLAGISGPLTFSLFALNTPFLLGGVFLGMKAYAIIPKETYLRIVLFMLLFLGVLLAA